MRRPWAIPALLALLVAACGGTSTPTTNAPRATPRATPRPLVSRCNPASAALLSRIEQGLTVYGGGSLANGQTVKSRDFESVYFVAADIQGEGVEVGVWATNSLTSGLTYSVNALAKEFSDWGDGGATDARLSMSDDGAAEAEACVR
jgi:hypothetical protein